jgi:Cu/Ag efflux protein CusF
MHPSCSSEIKVPSRKVTDLKMLSSIKEGDKIRFTADRIDGALTVTSIEDLSN